MQTAFPLDISVIVPVVERHGNLEELFLEYSKQFNSFTKKYEFLFVVDGAFDEAYKDLKKLKEKHANITIIKFAKNFHESIALMAGIEQSRGKLIFTLSSYFQVDVTVINSIMAELEKGYDLVITQRYPRQDNLFNRVQTFMFHAIVQWMTGCRFKDIACGIRGMKRDVALSLNLIGDMHRFIPIIAFQKGYKIKEVRSPQRKEERKLRLFGPGVYLRRLIDILSLFFLVKFTRKPLRFFGVIGLTMSLFGGAICFTLILMRIISGYMLSDKPMFLVAMVLFVLGIQTISLGLIGELIIFVNAREQKEYTIEEIL